MVVKGGQRRFTLKPDRKIEKIKIDGNKDFTALYR
jgi:hypothetical protein